VSFQILNEVKTDETLKNVLSVTKVSNMCGLSLFALLVITGSSFAVNLKSNPDSSVMIPKPENGTMIPMSNLLGVQNTDNQLIFAFLEAASVVLSRVRHDKSTESGTKLEATYHSKYKN